MLNSRKEISSSKTDKDLTIRYHNQSNGTLTSFSEPKITSTPLPLPRKESIFATPPKSRLLTPRKYLLSEIATPPRSTNNKKDFKKIGNSYKNTGPLLASLNYNDSVSTYEETKSPGLAGRIVQYSEETERRKNPTHHEKYGSPGLFPVVHLFKKNLPTFEQKPNRVTIQIGHSDHSKHHSAEYNRKLLEGIVRPSFANNDPNISQKINSESNTRSVLDALKEISRKRIHTNEDYSLNNDSGKRQKTDQFGEPVSNKRQRDGSPTLESVTSPTKPEPKRTCLYDEYAASCSSTKLVLEKKDVPSAKRKTNSLGTLTDNYKETKQVKLVTTETQTQTPIPSETIVVQSPIIVCSKETVQEEKTVNNKESPIKVFDDAPLERIRKNRLAILMGQLVGKDAALTTSETALPFSSINKPTTNELSSILAKKPEPSMISHKTTEKPEKHVHFNMPETPQVSVFGSATSVTQTSTSVATPIMSAIVSKSGDSVSKSLTAPPTSPVCPPLESSTSESTKISTPTFSFGAPSLSVPSANISAVSTPTVSSSSSFLNFSSAPVLSTTANNEVKSPPKPMGGFKFDLGKPTSNLSGISSSAGSSLNALSPKVDKKSEASAIPSLFSTTKAPTSTVVSSEANAPTFNFAKPDASSPKSQPFSFGSLPASTSGLIQPTFGATPITTTSSNTFSSPSFTFGNKSTTVPTTTQSEEKSQFSSLPSFGSTITNTVKPQANNVGFSFGSSTVTTSTTTSAFDTSNKPSFGLSSTTAFGSTASPFSPSSSTPAFGQTKVEDVAKTTSATNMFSSVVTAPNMTFGSSTQPVVSSANMFGAPSTQSTPFGAASNKFGISSTTITSTPAFGTNSAPAFSFGGSKPATNNVFGNGSSGFGPTATTSANSAFGTPQAFGNTNSTTTTSAFGAAQTFGGTNTGTTTSANPVFGFGSGSTPTTTSSVFGGTQAFGTGAATSGFGSNPSTNTFGQSGSSTSTFGGSSAFGGASTAFGSSTFNQNDKSGGFGTNNNNAFGASATTFGSGNDKPGFGFGASTGSSTFGKPATQPSVGSALTPSFGSSATPNAFNSPPAAPSSSFSFGSNNNPPKPAGVFAFGGSSSSMETPKPGGFNFGAGAASSTPFGGSSTGPPSFGSQQAPTFGGGAAPQFSGATPQFNAGGSAAPQFNTGGGSAGTGVFNIGAGSTPNSRNRTQLRAKRRT